MNKEARNLAEIQITAPNPNHQDPMDLSMKILSWALIISLAVHIIVGFFAVQRPLFFRDMFAQKPAIEINLAPQLRESVATLQDEAKEPPPDARFASDKNMRADEETSPDRAQSNIPKQGGGEGGVQQQQRAKPKAQPIPKTTFSYSQNDFLKDNVAPTETLRPGPKGIASAGFVEKLKRGAELKANAQFFDYGSFINRMREKLSQRWNPQRTVESKMYGQQQVSMEVGVVLSKEGEIVELRVMNSSNFSEYDQEVIRALREAGPYPNPPKSLIDPDGQVYMPWNFTLRMDSWGVARGVE